MDVNEMLIKQAIKIQLRKNKKPLVEYMQTNKINTIWIDAKKGFTKIETDNKAFKVQNAEQFIDNELLKEYNLVMIIQLKAGKLNFEIVVNNKDEE